MSTYAELKNEATRAAAGIIEANANFVDQAIFGPSVDGKSWNGKWGVASLYSSLMLVTIEDAGADTEVNIWDLTEVSNSAPSTTPLGTVTLSGAATPTSVAACMGYIIVGSEDGITIIDPHDGSWAERTDGYPKSLSTTTNPVLNSNNVIGVAAGLSDKPAYDPRTGGPLPTFGIKWGSGTWQGAVYKDDGELWYQENVAATADKAVAIHNGRVFLNYDSDQLRWSSPISTINASQGVNPPYLFIYGDNDPYNVAAGADKMSAHDKLIALASGEGLGFNFGAGQTHLGNAKPRGLNASITRTYNTGYYAEGAKGNWLANSKTADYSSRSNTLTENGTVTEAAVASGAELMGYSGFTNTTNYLSRASDADWDVVGTGTLTASGWFKCTAVVSSAAQYMIAFANSGASVRFNVFVQSDGTLGAGDDGATAAVYIYSGGTVTDSVWHKFDFVRVSSTERYLYLDSILVASSTTDVGSISDSGNLPLAIGGFGGTGGASAQNCTLALVRLSTTAPSATQIRQMYDAEKGMFVASAECLLQSGSTDAVLDVDVDPLTGKVLVTQTDAITIFDGLVVDSKPTVNSGSSEKGKLWGDLRTEQNSANAYVTAPAVDQRQVNEMVRGMASELPAGVDLSKAKAWALVDTSSITASFNIKSYTYTATGQYLFEFGIPFKTGNYVYVAGANGRVAVPIAGGSQLPNQTNVNTYSIGTSSLSATTCMVVFFGELENE
jgi:hypothetical protein